MFPLPMIYFLTNRYKQQLLFKGEMPFLVLCGFSKWRPRFDTMDNESLLALDRTKMGLPTRKSIVLHRKGAPGVFTARVVEKGVVI